MRLIADHLHTFSNVSEVRKRPPSILVCFSYESRALKVAGYLSAIQL